MNFKLLALLGIILYSNQVNCQNIKFTEKIKLDSTINTNGEEILPILRPDGKKLYFTRAFHPQNKGGSFGGMDIWSADVNDKQFLNVSNDYIWNSKENNTLIGVNHDSNIVYLLSDGVSEKGISFSVKNNDHWKKPELLRIPNLTGGKYLGYYMNPNFNVLLVSMKGEDSYGEEDLYVSLRSKNGTWAPLINLGPTINTKEFEISPFITNDNRYLFFSSKGHDGYGDADIYMSQRLYGSWDVWSKPINLGSNINSTKFDAYFSMYGDSIAFYSSNREGDFADIYQVKVDLIEESSSTFANLENRVYLTEQEITKVFGFDFKRVILFERNSSELDETGKEILWFIANKISKLNGIYLTVVGNSDIDGTEAENLELSKKRVNAVSEYLIDLGLDNWRISTKSQGEALATYTIEEQKKIDRKVEIYFYKIK